MDGDSSEPGGAEAVARERLALTSAAPERAAPASAPRRAMLTPVRGPTEAKRLTITNCVFCLADALLVSLRDGRRIYSLLVINEEQGYPRLARRWECDMSVLPGANYLGVGLNVHRDITLAGRTRPLFMRQPTKP
jgi:hypothetical protein